VYVLDQREHVIKDYAALFFELPKYKGSSSKVLNLTFHVKIERALTFRHKQQIFFIGVDGSFL